MTPPFGAQLFWMISIGLLVGYVGHFAFLKYSMPTLLSIAVSTGGAVILGLVAHFLAFEMPLLYSWVGAITCLFVANVFLFQEASESKKI